MFSEGDVILFTGDSITDCGRNRERPDSCGDGYANLLKSYLLYQHPNQNLTIYNKGISGNRIVDLYARFKEDCYNLSPTLISILIGVNDVWHEFSRKQGVETDKFGRIYDLLLEETKQRLTGVKLVMLEPFVLAGGLPIGKYSQWRKEINLRQEIVRRLAGQHGAIFVPLQTSFDEACQIAPDTYWLYDGVHPTAAGHALIAEEWTKAVLT